MPLPAKDRKRILEYCDRDLPNDDHVAGIFSFIEDRALFARVQMEFYAARYIYKLGEALKVEGERLHAHVKFQIVQYASIYEAIIVYFLWEKFSDHPAVADIEFHNSFKKAASLPGNLQLLTTSNEEVFLCTTVKQKTPRVSIKFDDKIDAAVRIGFVDRNLGEEIKDFYKLRNAIHIESAIKNQIKYEISSSQLAYLRMQPFTRGIKGFLQTGTLPDEARPRSPDVTSTSSEGIKDAGPA